MQTNKLQLINRQKEYLAPVIITFILLTISFLLHYKWCGSPITAGHELWEKRIQAHMLEYPFNIRIFTTPLVVFLSHISNLPYRELFFILQFTLAAILGPMFFGYLRAFKFDVKMSSIGTFLLISSYPIMAAHFEPVHTWDDFGVYIFLTASFWAMIKRKPMTSVVFFTLGCLAREQTMLYYPILVLGTFRFNKDISRIKALIISAIPVIVYGPYFISVHMPYDYNLLFNFETFLRTRDTLFSVFISFGFIWIVIPIVLLIQPWRKMSSRSKFLFITTVYCLISTLLIILLFARARETRLLFPPFVFLIPLSLLIIKPCLDYLQKYTGIIKKILSILIMHGLMIFGVFISFRLFPEFEYRQCPDFCREWTGINLGLMLSLILLILLAGRVREMIKNHLCEFVKLDNFSNPSEAV